MKREQMEIAEVLYELGMSYDIIEKITSVPPSQIKQKATRKRRLSDDDDKNDCNEQSLK